MVGTEKHEDRRTAARAFARAAARRVRIGRDAYLCVKKLRYVRAFLLCGVWCAYVVDSRCLSLYSE
jgi:hypothetical protein